MYLDSSSLTPLTGFGESSSEGSGYAHTLSEGPWSPLLQQQRGCELCPAWTILTGSSGTVTPQLSTLRKTLRLQQDEIQLSGHQTPLLQLSCTVEDVRTLSTAPSWMWSCGLSAEFFQRVTGLCPRPPSATPAAASITLVFPSQRGQGMVHFASQRVHKQPAAVSMKTTHQGRVLSPERKGREGSVEGVTTDSSLGKF